MAEKEKEVEVEYGIGRTGPSGEIPAPDLPYRPRQPQHYRPAIGLIGCGGISEMHLKAYQKAGYNVVALCSRNLANAAKRQQAFFPAAELYQDYRALLKRDDIEVVDITPHPADRLPILAAALNAGKHVLSQKPFVVDLDAGERLVDLAATNRVKLAVNQNGRWAPHFSYIRQAINAGLLGQVQSVQLAVHWDHNWIADTVFNQVEHLILYDFAIHWFDIATAFLQDRVPKRVIATATRSPHQKAQPPLLAQAVIQYDDAQATLSFNGDTAYGQTDRTVVVGSAGSAESHGPDLTEQQVSLYTAAGHAAPKLQGTWFEAGFLGTMAELLCAIEEDRTPHNNAADNLRSLALCFAAVASIERGAPVVPGTVRQLPGV